MMDHDRRLHLWLALPCATVAGCATILGTGDDLTFRSEDAGAIDSGVDAGAIDSGAEAGPTDADAATSAGDWRAGPSSTWSHSNKTSLVVPIDCCGCSGCTDCTDNTRVTDTPDGGLSFSSGEEISGGTGHKTDGFAAWPTDGVPVIPGREHLLAIDFVALGAAIAGSVGTETDPLYQPHWSIAINEVGVGSVGGTGGLWGTAQCQSCEVTTGSLLGLQQVPFKPQGNRVDVVISAHHASSQCLSEVHDVHVDIAWMSVIAQ